MIFKMEDFREQFDKENPDKTIFFNQFYGSNCGTTKYLATWTGDWDVMDLVSYADNSTGHFGGRLENVRTNENGSKTGTICVYYD